MVSRSEIYGIQSGLESVTARSNIGSTRCLRRNTLALTAIAHPLKQVHVATPGLTGYLKSIWVYKPNGDVIECRRLILLLT
jgi:hypothetical protein